MKPEEPTSRTVGPNDQFIATLGDETLNYPGETGLRTCGVCDHVRMSHVVPCVHCEQTRTKRRLVSFLGLLVVVAVSVVTAYFLGYVELPSQ